MIELKTREDVMTHSRAVFETAPFLVDLALALSDPDRRVTVKPGEIKWPVKR